MASIVAGDWAASTGARNPKLPETAISIVPRNTSKNPHQSEAAHPRPREWWRWSLGWGGARSPRPSTRHPRPRPARSSAAARSATGLALENNSFFHGPPPISPIGLVTWSLLTVPDPYFVTSGGGPSSRSPHRGCRRRVLSASPQPCRTDLNPRPSTHTTDRK